MNNTEFIELFSNESTVQTLSQNQLSRYLKDAIERLKVEDNKHIIPSGKGSAKVFSSPEYQVLISTVSIFLKAKDESIKQHAIARMKLLTEVYEWIDFEFSTIDKCREEMAVFLFEHFKCNWKKAEDALCKLHSIYHAYHITDKNSTAESEAPHVQN